jgi:hypothetical protein
MRVRFPHLQHFRLTFCPPSQLSVQEFAPSLSPSMIVSGILSDWPGTKRHLIDSRLHLKDQRQHINTDMLNELGPNEGADRDDREGARG